MDASHRETLLRIYQADASLRRDGKEPKLFHLQYMGGGEGPSIDHPRWDQSWPSPSEHTIDELDGQGMLRVEPSFNKQRSFIPTEKGRQEGEVLAQRRTQPVAVGGQAPRPDEILKWLIETDAEVPDCFDSPGELLDRAVDKGFVTATGREIMARRIIGLARRGYLDGDVPDLDQATSEQLLSRTANLELTIKAYEEPSMQGGSVTIFGSVVDSQVSAGDIANFTSFAQVLDRAYGEIEALEGIDSDTKAAATTMLDRLRDKVEWTSTEVATGAAGALVASVIARLIGLPAA